ncbi:TIR domain-containing protein [Brevundimonas sp.]|uniref:TIR domain-containing protein n=1 Tax=Brevundimonas sp. TaxID=1871086 RepID=UPI003FA5525B
MRATWGRKYVDWEIAATLDKGRGLIYVRLLTLYTLTNGRYPVPDRLFDRLPGTR